MSSSKNRAFKNIEDPAMIAFCVPEALRGNLTSNVLASVNISEHTFLGFLMIFPIGAIPSVCVCSAG